MPVKNIELCGLGNAIVDLIVQIPEEDLSALGLKKGGMHLVELDAQQEILGRLSSHNMYPACGGSGANTVILAASLGIRSAYGCLVGGDERGKRYLREMAELNVILPESAGNAAENSVTGTSLILVTPDAERTMNTHLGASILFDAEHVDETIISSSEWLYLEGYLFAAEAGQRAVRRAVEIAKRSGTKIALTFSDAFIVDLFHSKVAEVVQDCDLVFANFTEAKHFVGLADVSIDEADQVFQQFSSNVFPVAVMTMSERGALVNHNGERCFIPPTKVTAIDDTGAGDAFAAGFLTGMIKGRSALEAGSMGALLAGRVVSQLGPRLKLDTKKLIRAELGIEL